MPLPLIPLVGAGANAAIGFIGRSALWSGAMKIGEKALPAIGKGVSSAAKGLGSYGKGIGEAFSKADTGGLLGKVKGVFSGASEALTRPFKSATGALAGGTAAGAAVGSVGPEAEGGEQGPSTEAGAGEGQDVSESDVSAEQPQEQAPEQAQDPVIEQQASTSEPQVAPQGGFDLAQGQAQAQQATPHADTPGPLVPEPIPQAWGPAVQPQAGGIER